MGGIVAANISGPRRRLYGTARDLVIGMKFATLEGKLVQSGGMVVKNVAGLDMGKLMIGSFGTLAAIAVVEFQAAARARPRSELSVPFETWTKRSPRESDTLREQVPPAAVDLLNPIAAAQLGLKGYLLAVRVSGNAAVIERSAGKLDGERRRGARRQG